METNDLKKSQSKSGVKPLSEPLSKIIRKQQEWLDQAWRDHLSETVRRDDKHWRDFFTGELKSSRDGIDHDIEFRGTREAMRPDFNDVKKLEESISDLQTTLKRLKKEAGRDWNQTISGVTVSESKGQECGTGTVSVSPSPNRQRASFLASVSAFLPSTTREDIKDVIADLNRTGRELETKGWSRRRVSLVITAMSLRSLLGTLWCHIKEHATKTLPIRFR